MDREIETDSIHVLEEQIRERERTAVKLKRARNLLLNVSKLPPEILGDIFRWNVTFKDYSVGLDERSHNFLLVCHHWFEVASRTPEIWSFWGNTPRGWARWCHRSRTAPLDLALDGQYCDDSHLDTTLHNVLQDRATRDTIRRVHLVAENPEFLSSIIAPLTSNSKEIRSNGIQSLLLQNNGYTPFDVSDFFAHYRFPKLQRLDLFNCTTPSWDHLTSRTSVLTTLILDFDRPLPAFPPPIYPGPTPTTSQLLSTLASNPSLQKVGLTGSAVPDDGGGSSVRVKLNHLKDLRLEGDLGHVNRLLDRLDYPRKIDNLSLTLYDSHLTDISQIIGPYLRDHFQRRDRPQNGLNLRISSGYKTVYRSDRIGFKAGDARRIDFFAPKSEQMNTFVSVTVVLSVVLDESVLEAAALDPITYAPLEDVVYFRAHMIPIALEDVHARLPNLRALSFHTVSFPAAFPGLRPIGDGKIFPSLQHVLLRDVSVDRDDWGPLRTFLASRMSSGNRLDRFTMTDPLRVCQQVVEDVRGMVREFSLSLGNTDRRIR